jgi:GT2 family glycosyltransferase
MNASAAQPLISVVIPNYNGAAFLEACLASLLRQTYSNREILVVDNGSRDASVEIIRRVAPQARVLLLQRNLGFAGGVNAGVRVATGDWIAVLNNDTEAAPDWLEQFVSALARYPQAAFLACRILDFEERNVLYSAGDCFLRSGIGYRRGQGRRDGVAYHRDVEIFSAGGCACLYRKAVLLEANGYDENFFAYLEDVDLGMRLVAAGYRGNYVSQAVVFHRGGATSGGEFSSLTVRLRTRNALLLLKNFPHGSIWRWWPIVLAGQLVWLARVLAHGKLWSYLVGLGSVVAKIAVIFRGRRWMKLLGSGASYRLRAAILASESLARRDFNSSLDEQSSAFLKWYFRFF